MAYISFYYAVPNVWKSKAIVLKCVSLVKYAVCGCVNFNKYIADISGLTL
jgi:hypothetical protein